MSRWHRATLPNGCGQVIQTYVSRFIKSCRSRYRAARDRIPSCYTEQVVVSYDMRACRVDLQPTRLGVAIVRRTAELMPDAGHWERAEFWAGLRPATPSNIPYIGKSHFGNLYLNTGHGTLGWTMACGCGRVLSDIIYGETPEVETAGLNLSRYSR